MAYGEALLTLETPKVKAATVAETARPLRPGGRYGIHELLLTPDGLSGRSLRHPSVLPRLAEIWRTFGRCRDHLGALTLTAQRR